MGTKQMIAESLITCGVIYFFIGLFFLIIGVILFKK